MRSHQSWPTSRPGMRRWRRSARSRFCSPSDCRSAGHGTRARFATGPGGWARRSCTSTPPRRPTETATLSTGLVVVGLDGGYVRSRHRQEERHFEVIAGKVIGADGTQHRFAFARNGHAASVEAFAQALAVAGVHADTPATVLCDGDTGLWRLQREVLPVATVVLGWWHVAIRFEHALQTARGLGAADAKLADEAARSLEHAKWRLWHGRWIGCRRKLAGLYRWTKRKHVREIAGIDRLRRHISDLLGYLERNQDMLVHYAARRRHGEPISTAFVESAVNEMV